MIQYIKKNKKKTEPLIPAVPRLLVYIPFICPFLLFKRQILIHVQLIFVLESAMYTISIAGDRDIEGQILAVSGLSWNLADIPVIYCVNSIRLGLPSLKPCYEVGGFVH